jgi:endoglucanase
MTKSCESPIADCRESGDPCATDLCIESLGGCQFTCGATWETWTDIYGWTIDSLITGTNNMTNPPTKSERLGSNLTAPPKIIGENFGGRIKGWLMPPITGDYIFSIAADDTGVFWLSTDDYPAKKVLVCFTPGPVPRYLFSAYPEQQSAPIPLVAGRTYYFEVRLCTN